MVRTLRFGMYHNTKVYIYSFNHFDSVFLLAVHHHYSLSLLYPQAGKAPAFVPVFANVTSAALRLTNPGNTSPPALFHLGNSSPITVFGLSPAFSRFNSVELCTFAPPTLNVQLTSAPY